MVSALGVARASDTVSGEPVEVPPLLSVSTYALLGHYDHVRWTNSDDVLVTAPKQGKLQIISKTDLLARATRLQEAERYLGLITPADDKTSDEVVTVSEETTSAAPAKDESSSLSQQLTSDESVGQLGYVRASKVAYPEIWVWDFAKILHLPGFLEAGPISAAATDSDGYPVFSLMYTSRDNPTEKKRIVFRPFHTPPIMISPKQDDLIMLASRAARSNLFQFKFKTSVGLSIAKSYAGVSGPCPGLLQTFYSVYSSEGALLRSFYAFGLGPTYKLSGSQECTGVIHPIETRLENVPLSFLALDDGTTLAWTPDGKSLIRLSRDGAEHSFGDGGVYLLDAQTINRVASKLMFESGDEETIYAFVIDMIHSKSGTR